MRSLVAAQRPQRVEVTRGAPTEVAGAILTGGRSSRLGRDKAMFDPYGFGPMLQVGVEALRGAGIGRLATVGGDPRPSAGTGLEHLPDAFPGEGPLGGIITALRWSQCELVVVLACDMPFLDAAVITEMVSVARSDSSCGVVLAKVDDREQPLTALWRCSVVLPVLEEAFERGERAPRRVLPQLSTQVFEIVDPTFILDIDSQADVDRYAPIAERRRAGD